MDWGLIITGFVSICSTGGFVYLLLDKKVLSKQEKANANATEKENQQTDIHTGLEALNFYQEIDSLIKTHTDPLNAKIDELNGKVEKWCCFRRCEIRLRDESQADAEPAITLEDLLQYIKLQGK